MQQVFFLVSKFKTSSILCFLGSDQKGRRFSQLHSFPLQLLNFSEVEFFSAVLSFVLHCGSWSSAEIRSNIKILLSAAAFASVVCKKLLYFTLLFFQSLHLLLLSLLFRIFWSSFLFLRLTNNSGGNDNNTCLSQCSTKRVVLRRAYIPEEAKTFYYSYIL